MGGLPESRLREIHATLNEAIRKMGISFGESVSNVNSFIPYQNQNNEIKK